MSEVVHADIFFFITSLSVICITGAVLMLFYYLIPVAKDIRDIVRKVRKAGDEVERDFETLRTRLHEEGAKSKAIVDLVLGFVTRKLSVPSVKRPAQKKPPRSSSEK